jgi:chromate reductase
MPHDIAVIVGSLRRESFNRRLANVLIGMSPPNLAMSVVGIGELPLYNQDLEAAPPAPWLAFRARIRAAAGILFVTPEYNRSVPGVLKNAIDVGSRPPRESTWRCKPAGVVSVTTGRLGGFGANHHLRQSLMTLDMPTLAQPEIYIAQAAELFDGERLVRDDTRALLAKFLAAFEQWVERFATRPADPSEPPEL